MTIDLSKIPSVTRVLTEPGVVALKQRYSHDFIVDTIQDVLSSVRSNSIFQDMKTIVSKVEHQLSQKSKRTMVGAINATGVVLHTGLGRAVLSASAAHAVHEVARGHCILEIDTETGQRGSRQNHFTSLLTAFTGAESALVVNNNAAAVVLSIAALAGGKEVLISRGELVEIGGAFRIPEIIAASGAKLVEVGSTNRTRLSDFEKAITPSTGLILKCHPSNYRIVGFTEQPRVEDLVSLGAKHDIPVVNDLGSGAILDTLEFGISGTTTMSTALKSGVSAITASGDKLLGGPQCGLILGKAKVVAQMATHPLARAFRIDKLSLAALEATLREYQNMESVRNRIPTLRYLSRTIAELELLAAELELAIKEIVSQLSIGITTSESQVGGGSLPGEMLPTVCVRVSTGTSQKSANDIVYLLRMNSPAIFARVHANAVLLDPRTLECHDFATIANALSRIEME